MVTDLDLDDTLERIRNILSLQTIKCSCGKTYNASNVTCYKYPKSDEYWVYAHCSKCGHDLGYPKINSMYTR